MRYEGGIRLGPRALGSLTAPTVLCLMLLGPFARSATAAPFAVNWGTSVVRLNELAPSYQDQWQRKTGKLLSVGYKYSSFGVFWLNVWTWSGEYCLTDGQGYYSLPGTEIAKMIAPGSRLEPPFLYRFPLGWIVIAFVLVVGIPSMLIIRMMNRSSDPSPSLLSSR